MKTFVTFFFVFFALTFDICTSSTSQEITQGITESVSKYLKITFGHKNILAVAPLKPINSTTSHPESESSEEIGIKYLENSTALPDYSTEFDLDSGEELKRKELCSQESNGRKVYLYDTKAKICGLIGEKGHCGANMVFRSEVNSTVFGYCECNFGKFKLPLVYHEKSNKCYSIYTKAYCQKGQWLVFSKENTPVCQTSLCDIKKKSKILRVPLNGDGPCVKLGVGSEHCLDREEIVQFEANQPISTCGRPRRAPTPRLLSPVNQNNCPPGSFANVSGRCQGSWSW